MSSKLRVVLASCAALICAGALLSASAGASVSPATSHARGGCGIKGDQRDFGKNMYLDALATRHASCHVGRQVVNQYSACRYSHGGLNGRCPNRVKGYRCSEGKRTVAPGIQYSVAVGCRKGSHRVSFTYTQQV